MPSPLGHALAGMAIAWSAEALRPRHAPTGRVSLAFVCALAAVAPDLDFIYPPAHRTATHSFAAVGVAGLVAWWWVRGSARARRAVWACALAYGSHLLMDWAAGDTKTPAGLQLWWPVAHRWYTAPVPIFRPTTLGRTFFEPDVLVSNVLAVVTELLIVVPLAAAAYVWRRARRG